MITGYQVKGHANYSEPGEDIVCAAVSSLAQTGVYALEKLLECDLTVTIKKGYLACKLPEKIGSGTLKHGSLILETIIIGFYETAMNYSQWVSISDEGGVYQ